VANVYLNVGCALAEGVRTDGLGQAGDKRSLADGFLHHGDTQVMAFRAL
jgi:hypothetical protein